MRADALLLLEGARLVGAVVQTQPRGEWPGGRAIVTAIAPDPAAPEIVFLVEGIDGQIPAMRDLLRRGRGVNGGWEIGVFEFEDVELVPEVAS